MTKQEALALPTGSLVRYTKLRGKAWLFGKVTGVDHSGSVLRVKGLEDGVFVSIPSAQCEPNE